MGAAKTTKVDGAEAEAAGDDKKLRGSFTNERGRGAAGDGKSKGESQLAMTRKREPAAVCAQQWWPYTGCYLLDCSCIEKEGLIAEI